MTAPFTVQMRWRDGGCRDFCNFAYIGDMEIGSVILGDGIWTATGYCDGTFRINLGTFPTLDAAKAAVEEWAKKYLTGESK